VLRRLLLLGLALCGAVHAADAPRLDLTVRPAWQGWARPGRTSEIEIRLGSDATTRASLDIVAGLQTVHAEVDLQPGRVVRLHLPLSSIEGITVSATSPAGPPQHRDIALAPSESPLLGVGLATGETVRLEGFHAVALAADDLPRNASAYAGIDALVLDAPTLGALDRRQLGALLTHAAGCGRIVVLSTDPRVRHALDGAAGCAGRALMSAASAADAMTVLRASLASGLPAALSVDALGESARPGLEAWHRVVVMLAVCFAAMALAVVFSPALPVLLLVPALAAAAVLGLLHTMPAPSRLVVWSEGDSGARIARYQAWQHFPGAARERARVALTSQLASSAQPCERSQAMRLDLDASGERVATAEFDARLFHAVSICYGGSFPMARVMAAQGHPDGSRDVRNAGPTAWPAGWLLAGGLVHDLPALGPGAQATLGAKAGRPAPEGPLRTAMARIRPDAAAALWPLELGGVADAPAASKGWLLVSIPAP
jgi:hypothetical protein